MLGQPEQRTDIIRLVVGHPADAHALGARREPKVLDREAGAVDVGVGDRVSAEHLPASTVAVATDADAERRFADPLELEVEVLPRPLVEVLGLNEAFARGERLHRRLGLFVLDDDETPRLHQADRRRAVRGREQATQQGRRERIRAEAADVATFADCPPDARAGGFVKAPAGRILAALAGARIVELERQHRPLETLADAHGVAFVADWASARRGSSPCRADATVDGWAFTTRTIGTASTQSMMLIAP